jgi:hypothetical protein
LHVVLCGDSAIIHCLAESLNTRDRRQEAADRDGRLEIGGRRWSQETGDVRLETYKTEDNGVKRQ